MTSAMTHTAHFSRHYRFSASHRLHVNALSDEQNRQTYGKCNHPYGHGHNYTLEVTVCGPIAVDTGMVTDMVELDRHVRENIVTRFHLNNLNHDPDFSIHVPSTENLCRAVWQLMKGAPLGTARLERIRIEETANNAFAYSGDETVGSHKLEGQQV